MQLRHKFNAVPVERDGIKFASKREARHYDKLVLLRNSGDIVFFLRQVPFHMPGVKYVADFMVFWSNGTVTVEDAKGMVTDTYKSKMRQMAIHYPAVEVLEV